MASSTEAGQAQQQAAPEPPAGLQAAFSAFQHGRPDETAALCARILMHKPHEPGALHLLGVAYLALGQVSEAVETLTRAAAIDPENAEILANLGAALRTDGQLDAAETRLRQAITQNPDNLQAHFNLGNTLGEAGRTAEAAACYRRVVNAAPSHANAHNNLGLALEIMAETEQAMACFQAAVDVDPGHRDANRNIARILRGDGRLAESLAHYEAVVAAIPSDIASHNDRGVVLFELERVDEAVAALRNVLALEPDCVDAHINLGNVLCATNRPDEAITHFESALELDPACVDAVVNMGDAQKQQADMRAAIATYDRALEMNPADDDAWFGKGLCHLLIGEFAAGWRGYRNRESMRGADAGFWREELPDDLSGRRVLVVRDRSIGDEVFFLRFLPALARRGAAVAYLPDARLADILARAGLVEIASEAEAAADSFDFKLSAGDLPLVVGSDPIGDTPPSIALAPLPEREARLGERLAEFGPPPYVGVTWRAGTRGRQGLLYKDSPVSRMAAALAPFDVRVIALQRAPRAGEVAAFADALGRPVCDLTDLNADLEDMLALVGLLDDHVCVSNTNVHLAAARDHTCRLLIPNPPEFRWLAAGDESPWFPGMTVYRQDTDGDWSAAFAALTRDLATVLPPG